MEDSYLGMLHDDHYSEYNYYGSQVYVPAASPGPSKLSNLYIPVQTDQVHIRMQTAPVHVRITRLIKLRAAKTRIQELTRAEKGEKVQGNKRQSTTPLRPEEERYLVNNFYVIDTLWLTNILLFFSAPKIDKLKIWRRQILSRFLVEPNKFCQSIASRPLTAIWDEVNAPSTTARFRLKTRTVRFDVFWPCVHTEIMIGE